MGTELKVCYAACAVVTVNDRGHTAAAEEVELTAVGADVVDVQVLG